MTVTLGDFSGGHGGIFAGDELHAGETLQIALALGQCLLMGVNFRNVLPPGTGLGQQIVVHLQPHATDNAEIVLHHQIVNGVDAAGGAVFQRQYAVAAQALFNGGEHRLERGKVHDVRQLKELIARKLRIGAGHALTGNGRLRGEQLGRFAHSGLNFACQRRIAAEEPVLVAAAELKEQRIQRGGIVPQRLGGGLDGFLQLLPFPDWVQHRQAVLLFIGCDTGGNVHPFGEQLY